jgi:hypothetical protein
MEIQTTLAKNIQTADDKANYDEACKRLLAEKIILAWIMKSCTEEYQDYDVKEIAEKYIEGTPQVSGVAMPPDETNAPMLIGLNTEDTTMTEGTIYYDIRFLAALPNSGEAIRLIINVEAQNDFYPGYPLITRGIYYCCRMISSQYGSVFAAPHYEKLHKVYSIWICMNPPKNRENTITSYAITEKNRAGSVKEQEKNYDLLTAVMICLGDSNEKGSDGILRLLDVLLSTETKTDQKKQILRDDYDIPMTQNLERRLGLMCNLSKGVEEKGIEKGLQLGDLIRIIRVLRNATMKDQSIYMAADLLDLTPGQADDLVDIIRKNQGRSDAELASQIRAISDKYVK